MGTGSLRLAIIPGLILLSLSLAERCSGSAGWVFTEPQLRASAGDSVLLQCLFLGPVAKDWTLDKVDWLRTAGPGTQKVGRDQRVGGGAGRGGRWQGRARRQPCCSQEAAGKPVRLAQATRGGRFPCAVAGHLHRSPCPAPQGKHSAGCCILGLSESVGTSWACVQRVLHGRGRVWI